MQRYILWPLGDLYNAIILIYLAYSQAKKENRSMVEEVDEYDDEDEEHRENKDTARIKSLLNRKTDKRLKSKVTSTSLNANSMKAVMHASK